MPTNLRLIFTAILLCMAVACAERQSAPAETSDPKRPNILLVVFEDMSSRIGAFGDPVANTPVLDALAKESILYPNTFTTSGVCAPSRAALMTGMHQQTIGAQHMRTARYETQFEPDGFEIGYAAVPPPEVKAFPELLRAAGYTTISGLNGWPASNKRDYQFGNPFTIWDQDGPNSHWRNAPKDKPFFAMVTLATTHESFIWPEEPASRSERAQNIAKRNRSLLAGKERVTDPADVTVPPYLPDTPVVRADIARHYDNIHFTEKNLGVILDQLKEDGLDDETVVIVTTDHGDGLPRAKRSVYDSGIKAPMLIRMPDRAGARTIDDRLVSFVDLAPTILALAGVAAPDWMQGRSFLAEDNSPVRDYIFAASDRQGDQYDRIKAARDLRFKYIRNYVTDKPSYLPVDYREELPTMMEIRRLAREDALTPAQRFYLKTPRPDEELYDVQADPDEIENLVSDPAYANTRDRMSQALAQWLERTPDLTAIPEREMVEAMWPDFQQPTTSPPRAIIRGQNDVFQLSFESSTPGASIGYRLATDQPGRWRLYSTPVNVAPGTVVEAKAQRYGYAESETVQVTVEEHSSSQQ